MFFFNVFIGNSLRVIDTHKNIQHTESQTYYQNTSIITSSKMVQTENIESNIVAGDNDNNVEIRTLDECVKVYKTQVK